MGAIQEVWECFVAESAACFNVCMDGMSFCMMSVIIYIHFDCIVLTKRACEGGFLVFHLA